MQLGLTREELAKRMETSHSLSPALRADSTDSASATMRKLAKALDAHLVYGFQDEAPELESRRTPKRELVMSAADLLVDRRTSIEAILARHGEQRLDPEEFERHFGSLPADDED